MMGERNPRFLWPLTLVGAALIFGLGACQDPSSPELPGLKEEGPLMVSKAPSATALSAKSTFTASLSGGEAGTDSRGAGEAVFRFNEDDVHFRLNVANIQNVIMAHIHVASTPGGDGPPVVWLYPSAPPPSLIAGRTQGGLGYGTFGASALVGPLGGMSLSDLRAAMVEGRAYVNVHTSQHLGGEIRGPIQ